jgi:hypothetical protein
LHCCKHPAGAVIRWTNHHAWALVALEKTAVECRNEEELRAAVDRWDPTLPGDKQGAFWNIKPPVVRDVLGLMFMWAKNGTYAWPQLAFQGVPNETATRIYGRRVADADESVLSDHRHDLHQRGCNREIRAQGLCVCRWPNCPACRVAS